MGKAAGGAMDATLGGARDTGADRVETPDN
jgi:hypothetical protein